MDATSPSDTLGTTRAASSHRLDIQGLRAIAVLLVVAFHAGLPVPGGFTGVDVFFVISGFVISALLLRELDATGRVVFRRFYSRRIKRLFPALALVVAVVAIATIALGGAQGASENTATTGLGAILLAANVAIYQTTGGYFDLPAESNALLHTWSLSVEEQFYLVFPALVAVAWRVGARSGSHGGGRGVGAVLAFSGAASFALAQAGEHLGRVGISNPASFTFYASPTRAWEFAAGAGLALAATRLRSMPPKAVWLAGVGGTALIVASGMLISDATPFPGTAALLPVVGTVLLIAAGADPGAPVARMLSLRPLVWIGDRSYSWYLWHWPVIVFAKGLFPGTAGVGVAAAFVSLVPAALSYRLVENPIRRRASIRGRRLVALVGACVVVPTLACSTVLVGAELSTPASESMAMQVGPQHVAYSLGCHGNPGHLDQRWTGACRFNTDAAGAPLYLVGDSQAAMLSEALILSAGQLGRPLVIASQSGCPLLDAVVDRAGVPVGGCAAYVAETLQHLEATPGIVVIASAELYVLDDGLGMTPSGGAPSARVTGVAAKAELYRRALASVVERLKAAGNQVLIVQPIPHFFQTGTVDSLHTWDPSLCSTVLTLLHPAGCGVSRSLADVMVEQAPVFDANALVAGHTLGMTLDLRGSLCDPDGCATNLDNTWHYRDGTHLSVARSTALAPIVVEALAPMIGRPAG